MVRPTPTGGQGQEGSSSSDPTRRHRVETVVDEEQLQKRLLESQRDDTTAPVSVSSARLNATSDKPPPPPHNNVDQSQSEQQTNSAKPAYHLSNRHPKSNSSGSDSSSSSTAATTGAARPTRGGPRHTKMDDENSNSSKSSPPPAQIIIPPEVARSISHRSHSLKESARKEPNGNQASSNNSTNVSLDGASQPPRQAITREQLNYGPLLMPGEVQVLYRSPDSETLGSNDRNHRDEQAKLVAPNARQSPISILSINPTYELHNKPLILDYPATVENLRLNNTGFFWEIKIPYQISIGTALHGAHLVATNRYRLDQFHCHWGSSDDSGSEHTVDNHYYSGELHFVHYNFEKYHTMSKAARNPDGLVVVSVFLDATDDHYNHAELEKIVSHLKHIPLKGTHHIIKQAVRIENLLPSNRSYWSYQGSLTTPPYYESVTWFILKQPIKCSKAQVQKFRNLSAAVRSYDNLPIKSNHRKTQPLNGRTVVSFDEPTSTATTTTIGTGGSTRASSLTGSFRH